MSKAEHKLQADGRRDERGLLGDCPGAKDGLEASVDKVRVPDNVDVISRVGDRHLSPVEETAELLKSVLRDERFVVHVRQGGSAHLPGAGLNGRELHHELREGLGFEHVGLADAGGRDGPEARDPEHHLCHSDDGALVVDDALVLVLIGLAVDAEGSTEGTITGRSVKRNIKGTVPQEVSNSSALTSIQSRG